MKYRVQLLSMFIVSTTFVSISEAGFITYSGAGEVQYLNGNPFSDFGDDRTPFDFSVTVDMKAPNESTSTTTYEQFRILSGDLNIDGRDATLLPNFDGSSSTINIQDTSADFFGLDLAFTVDGITSKIAVIFRFPKGTFTFEETLPVFSSLTTSGEASVISGSSRDFGRVQTWTEAGTVLTAETSSVVPEPASMALWGLGSLGIGVIARRRQRKQIAA